MHPASCGEAEALCAVCWSLKNGASEIRGKRLSAAAYTRVKQLRVGADMRLGAAQCQRSRRSTSCVRKPLPCSGSDLQVRLRFRLEGYGELPASLLQNLTDEAPRQLGGRSCGLPFVAKKRVFSVPTPRFPCRPGSGMGPRAKGAGS